MRGKALYHHLSYRIIGITPAHAGKSNNNLVKKSYKWDHPRTCGEKIPDTIWVNGKTGSPTHMRGKVQDLSYQR